MKFIRVCGNDYMARPRKDGKSLNIKLESHVAEELELYCEETGQTKTVAVERILSSAFKEYFDQPEGKRVPK